MEETKEGIEIELKEVWADECPRCSPNFFKPPYKRGRTLGAFCTYCGSQTYTFLAPLCECGKALWPHEKFCSKCGRQRMERLKKPKTDIFERFRDFFGRVLGKTSVARVD